MSSHSSPHAHHHEDPHATRDTPGATHDPVCNHWVIPHLAHGSSVVDAGTVHFCSVACKRAFDKDPGAVPFPLGARLTPVTAAPSP